MFNGKTHYKWPFSIAMLNYQRVPQKMGAGPQAAWGIPSYADVPASTSLRGSAATALTATSAAWDSRIS